MSFKKLTSKMSELREMMDPEDFLGHDDRDALKQLVAEAMNEMTSGEENIHYLRPVAHNDNCELSADQHFRLRLMEKTGTGSYAIH